MSFDWKLFSGNKIGLLKRNPDDLEPGGNLHQLDVQASVGDVGAGAGTASKEQLLLYGKSNSRR